MTTETRSTCPYCGVGCGVLIQAEGGQITGVRGDPEHPANFGRLCSKGSTLHLTARPAVTQASRLLQPLQRLRRGAAPTPLGWDAALDLAAERLAAIHTAHGPDAIGVYVSGQLLTEDYYVFNKLVKGLLGSNHIDTNSRLCMSSAVAGYKATLGADAPPCSYEDLDHAHTVFITGSNMAWAHPVLFRRLEDAKRAHPAQKWIVADPRRTETAEAADLHLPLLPGSDVALYHGLLHLMLWEGLTDPAYIAAHTTGFEALKARVREFTPAHTARLTGLKEADLVTAAQWFGASPATLSLYCQGLNQSSSGTDKNAALINLHLATGQIGKPGAGPFSLTGQPNAMGGREVGGLANLLSAHRDLNNRQHRAEVAALWGVPSVPEAPGLTAVEMFQAAADGQIKALWIACTNPAQSLPDQATVHRALERAEFVIVQEAFAGTATAAYADLLLPATTWGEKDGTVTNSERRISRVRPAVAAPGQARHDWAMAADIARRLAARIAPERAALFDYPTPESVWREHRESTRGRDLDITGLSYAMLDAAGPQQWPLPAGAATGQARLYEDGVFPTADGRARFADVPFTPLAEPRSARYPFSLTTGRLRDQWHGMSRTGQLGRLWGHVAEPLLSLHPQDLARLRLADGALVRVRSARGSLVLPVRASTEVAPTQAAIPMHWGPEVLGGQQADGTPSHGVNHLTTPAFCPRSKQPELKHSAVAIEPAALPWRLSAMVWLPTAAALVLRQRLQPLLGQFEAASLLPFGREADVVASSGREADVVAGSGREVEVVKGAGRETDSPFGPATDPAAPAQADAPGGGDATDQQGLWLRLACAAPPAAERLAALRAPLGFDAPGLLRYADPRRGSERVLQLQRRPDRTEGADQLRGFWLSSTDGDAAPAASAWLAELLQAQQDLPVPGRQLLAPGTLARQHRAAPSPQVCTCFNVSEAQIRDQLGRCEGAPDQRLAQLQGALRCGSHCGSCLPKLRQLVAAVAPSVAPNTAPHTAPTT